MATNIVAILSRLGLTASAAPADQPAPSAPGCAPWCRGEGARRTPAAPRALSTDGVPSYLETMRAVAYEYCPCPAGTAARGRHQAALSALEAAATQRSVTATFDAAELPPKLRHYGLGDYPALAPMIDKLRRWQSCSHAAGANLILWGDLGTYKTSLAAALLREHLADGGSGLFLVSGDFLSRLRASYAADASADDRTASEWTLIRAASAPGLLVLDDVDVLSEWARSILFRLLNARDLHERPTIITTNLDLDALEASLGKRTFDRFRGGTVDHASGEQFVMQFQGRSQRGLSVVKPSGPTAPGWRA